VCDPPAEPGSIWEREAESLSVDEVYPVPMCKYRGDVLFIVNTAAV
jgi:glutathione peroxidase-family protein